MANALLSPNPKFNALANAGVFGNGYKLYTYASGTTTPLATYSDRAGTIPNANPIVLDARGEATIYLTAAVAYRYVLKTDLDVTVWTRDDVVVGEGTADGGTLRTDVADGTVNTKGSALIAHYDPVAPAYLKTTSDIINGERVSVFRNVPKADWDTVRLGTNTTDLTTRIQALMDAMDTVKRGELYFPSGTYTSGTLNVPGGITLRGEDATIKAISTLGTSANLLANKNPGTGATQATFDNNIRIERMTFDMTALSADRLSGALAFVACGDLTLDRVYVKGGLYMGVTLAGCKRVRLLNFHGTGTGKSAVSSEGGATIWIGDWASAYSEGIHIVNPYIHDTNWSALYLNGRQIKVIEPQFYNTRESAIYSNDFSQYIEIVGGLINTTTKKNISASGIELGGSNHKVIGTTITDCGNTSMSMTNCQNTTLAGVVSRNARRDAASFPNAMHFSLVSGTSMRDFTMTGCSAQDYSSPAASAVDISGSGGTALVNALIEGNNFAGTAWTSGKAVNINPSYWDSTTCTHRNNAGANDASRTTAANNTATQSISSTVWTDLTFSTTTYNNDGMYNAGSPNLFTVPKDARRVVVDAGVEFTPNATGQRGIRIIKNGAVFAGNGTHLVNASGSLETILTVRSTEFAVAAGDVIKVQVFQSSGGALNVAATCWASVKIVD